MLEFKVGPRVSDTEIVAAAAALNTAIADGDFVVKSRNGNVVVDGNTVTRGVTLTGNVDRPLPPAPADDSDQWHTSAVSWLVLLGVMLVLGIASTVARRPRRKVSGMGRASVVGFM